MDPVPGPVPVNGALPQPSEEDILFCEDPLIMLPGLELAAWEQVVMADLFRKQVLMCTLPTCTVRFGPCAAHDSYLLVQTLTKQAIECHH